MDAVTGIIMNNNMDDFSIPGHTNYFGLPPSPFNYVAPLKRPLSSTSLVIARRGNERLVLGGAGGSLIISSVAQVFLNIQDGMEINDAIRVARLHHQLVPNSIRIESGFPGNIIEKLEARGHSTLVVPKEQCESQVQVAYLKSDGLTYAASDPRKQANAAAF